MIELKVNKQNAISFNDKLKNMQKFLSNQGNYSDQTLFKTYCNYFRQVCNEIGSLINVSNFKGSNQEILNFYGSDEYKTEKGVQLAIALDTTKNLCQYQAVKLNIYNQWFDKCWEGVFLGSSSSNSNSSIFESYSSNSSSSSNIISDLIQLGILTKPLAQYTIGESIFIPYTDTSNVITSPIEFQVVGINHHKENSLTLMTKNIIRYAAFDAMEPNNPNSDRASHGNNNWGLSNIRQWLNSTKGAYSWWSPTHEYDLIINSDGFDSSLIATSPGFLSGFSSETLQHFATVQNVTAIPQFDGGGYETTQDKAFLASYTEMGFGNNEGIAEGAHLSIKYPDPYPDYYPRIKSGADGWYWMRSPRVDVDLSYRVWYINDVGDARDDGAIYGNIGLAPLVVLH